MNLNQIMTKLEFCRKMGAEDEYQILVYNPQTEENTEIVDLEVTYDRHGFVTLIPKLPCI